MTDKSDTRVILSLPLLLSLSSLSLFSLILLASSPSLFSCSVFLFFLRYCPFLPIVVRDRGHAGRCSCFSSFSSSSFACWSSITGHHYPSGTLCHCCSGKDVMMLLIMMLMMRRRRRRKVRRRNFRRGFASFPSPSSSCRSSIKENHHLY